MIEVFIHNVGVDIAIGTPILVLTDREKSRLMPIWIGLHEAGAIQRAMMRVKAPRPMTHELLFKVIIETGYSVARVEITELDDGKYFSNLVLQPFNQGEIKRVDARPSDAIAVALLAGAPIFCAMPVFAEATVAAEPEKEQESAQDFKSFVSELKASDFGKLK